MQQGEIIFFTVTEQVWDKPFTMKRHHVCDTKSVILRGVVQEQTERQFKAKLTDNNGFEKDGESFVFSKGQLLSNQNFTDLNRLGKWSS